VEVAFAILLIFVAGFGFAIQHGKKRDEARARQAQLDRLSKKYADSPFRNDILKGVIRPGMTVENLVDAWGPPAGVEERVLKTKIVHTYKYAQTGTRSFRQRVKIENGIVVGWSQN